MNKKNIDLTQTLYEGIPDWLGSCGFQMKTVLDYPEGVRVHTLETPNGIGTHMDAPNHFIEGAEDISEISLEKLICPGVMIDVKQKAHADYFISEQDIIDFENQYGLVPENSIVIGSTGWDKHWESPAAYRNPDSEGLMHFPGFSPEVATLLLKRNISGIAIDTLSPDGSNLDFPVHHILMREGKYIIENLKVPVELPPAGFTITALPMKIQHATEAPCRIVATVNP